jgi:hypothetical protein
VVNRAPPRTLLEQLLRAGDYTLDEWCEQFGLVASSVSERATLSTRQLQRWASGEIIDARAASKRVATRVWGHPFGVLVSPPRQSADEPTAEHPTAEDRTGDGRDQSLDLTATAMGPPTEPDDTELTIVASSPLEADLADRAHAFVRWALHSNTTDEWLDRIEESAFTAAVDLTRGPPLPVIADLRQIRDELFAALEGRHYPRHGRRLYATSAVTYGLLACAEADYLGRYRTAAKLASAAVAAADLAESDAIAAWGGSLQSAIAFWRGRYLAAANIAQRAQASAPAGVESARLATLAARAWAKLGEQARMQEALDEAADVRSPDRPSTGAGIMAFSYANQLRIAANAQLLAGRPDAAVPQLIEVIEQLQNDSASYLHSAAARADLAIGCVRTGDLDGADAALRPLLTLTRSGQQLFGAARRSEDLLVELEGPDHGGSRAAQELAADVRVFAGAQAELRALGTADAPVS